MKKTWAHFGALTAVIMLAAVPAAAFHDDPGRAPCFDCHVSLPLERTRLLFQDNVLDVCRACHPDEHAGAGSSHPVEVVPSMSVPFDMRLDGRGRITCTTCHLYHVEEERQAGGVLYPALLRRPPGRGFCVYCHGDM